MSTLYILYSPKLKKYYTGITTGRVQERLEKHNLSTYGSHFTSQANDWIIKLSLEIGTYTQARRMELYIKKRKSRIYIEELIENETMQKILKEKTAG